MALETPKCVTCECRPQNAHASFGELSDRDKYCGDGAVSSSDRQFTFFQDSEPSEFREHIDSDIQN
jgi:hypothetical protein